MNQSRGDDFEKKRSQAVIRAQAMKELEKEKQVGTEESFSYGS